MTIRSIKAALVGAALLAGFSASSAQAATASATARATILRQVTLNKTADLDFGTIITGTTASSVVVSSAGARTCNLPAVCSGTVSAAAFGIVGTTGQTVTLAATGPVTLTSGTNTMSATLATSAATRVLTGTDSFTVGGTLSVGANQADGVYTGSFNVTVDYQ
jgi:Mat/Ecp fimbriae major subunit